MLDAHLAAIARLNPEAQRDRDPRRRSGARRRAPRRSRDHGAASRLGPLARPALRRQGRDATPRASAPPIGSPLFTPTSSRKRTPRWSAASRPPAPSCSPRPTRRNSRPAPTPSTRCSARPAIPGIPRSVPAGSSGGSAVAVATGMLPLAQGTDFGCSIRIPAAFCGIVGIRPTPGLTPNYPMPLGMGPRPGSRPARPQRRGCGADARRDGRVQPPLADLGRAAMARARARSWRAPRDARGLRIAYASDIAGIGVDAEIDDICRAAARRLGDAGATVEEIAFDVSDGRDPYQAWRGAWMVGQQLRPPRAARGIRRKSPGQRRARARPSPPLDLAAAEATRLAVFHRFRELFERFDVLLTPAAPVKPYPDRDELPDRDRRPHASRTTSTGSRRRSW